MSRAERILELLEDTRSISVDDLADALGISRRTVATEVLTLQDQLGNSAAIALDDGRYSLLIADPPRYRASRAQAEARSFNDPAARADYVIARLFRAIVPVRIDELAAAMSVGRTTVVTDLERARARLEGTELGIEGRPNVGLTLRGPELQQRLYVLRNQLDSVAASPHRVSRITELVHELGSGLTRERVRGLIRWALLTVDRVTIGYRVSLADDTHRGLAGTPGHHLAQRLGLRLSQEFGVEIDADETLFLTLPVAGMRDVTDPVEPDSEPARLVDVMLEAIYAEMAIDLAGSGFLSEFARHVAYLINRARYRIWIDDPSVGDLREAYPVAYRMARLAQRVLEERIGAPVDEAELGYLAAYFQVFLERGGRREVRPPTVAVVAGNGAVRAELVRMQLAKLLPVDTDFRMLSAETAGRQPLAGYDLIVVMGECSVESDAPVLQVSRVLDRRAMERQLERMQLHIPLRGASPSGSVLAGSLDDAHFFALPAGTSYADGLEFMTWHLEGRGLVEQGFADRIREREATAEMRLDPWVAFPHATLTTQTTFMLSVGVVPRADDEDGVRLIVLLGVPAQMGRSEDILVHVYDEVLRLGARRDLIEALCTLTSFEEFYYFLERHPLTESRR